MIKFQSDVSLSARLFEGTKFRSKDDFVAKSFSGRKLQFTIFGRSLRATDMSSYNFEKLKEFISNITQASWRDCWKCFTNFWFRFLLLWLPDRSVYHMWREVVGRWLLVIRSKIELISFNSIFYSKVYKRRMTKLGNSKLHFWSVSEYEDGYRHSAINLFIEPLMLTLKNSLSRWLKIKGH